jgi:cell division protein ZapA
MSDPQAGVVQVKIYDREYTLRTSGDPARLQEVCRHLDARMRQLSATSGSVDTLKLAILTAISIADDLLRVQQELVKMDESVSRRSKECVSMLDRFLC